MGRFFGITVVQMCRGDNSILLIETVHQCVLAFRFHLVRMVTGYRWLTQRTPLPPLPIGANADEDRRPCYGRGRGHVRL